MDGLNFQDRTKRRHATKGQEEYNKRSQELRCMKGESSMMRHKKRKKKKIMTNDIHITIQLKKTSCIQ